MAVAQELLPKRQQEGLGILPESRCDFCGRIASVTRCHKCGGLFCSEHILPEDHACTGSRRGPRQVGSLLSLELVDRVSRHIRERPEDVREALESLGISRPTPTHYPRIKRWIGRYRLPESVRQQVLGRDGYACQKCGSNYGLEIHHVVPRSMGGSDELDNLTTLCRHCHQEETRRFLEEARSRYLANIRRLKGGLNLPT